MDDTITEDVFSLKNDDFYGFIHGLVGQQIVDVLKFQSITSRRITTKKEKISLAEKLTNQKIQRMKTSL
jgi:asparagine N-glycosylation enzyme membrane subunit Stt3